MATLDELINRMYDMVQDAKGIPLAGEKCILERDQMLDLLDELRSTLPNDLQAAQDIVAKRNDLLASGKREAEAIRRKAEEDARQMVSETEIVVAARKKAKEVQGNADAAGGGAQPGTEALRQRVLRGHPQAHRGGCCSLARRGPQGPSALQEHRKVNTEKSGDCFAAVPLFLFRGKSVQDGKSTRQTSNKCSELQNLLKIANTER